VASPALLWIRAVGVPDCLRGDHVEKLITPASGRNALANRAGPAVGTPFLAPPAALPGVLTAAPGPRPRPTSKERLYRRVRPLALWGRRMSLAPGLCLSRAGASGTAIEFLIIYSTMPLKWFAHST
jgi:hypothetical protein